MKKNIKHLLFLLLSFLTINITCQAQENKIETNDQFVRFDVCDVPIYKRLIPTKPYKEVVIGKMIRATNKQERDDFIYNKQVAIRRNKSLTQKQKAIKYKELEKALYNNTPLDVPVRKLEATLNNAPPLISAGYHGFMYAMHYAYMQHYPLTLSPDMIWLLIAQGFAQHINQHPEKFRDHFVNFDGKKHLDVICDDCHKGNKNANWPEVFKEFGKKIGENTSKELVDLVTGDFSTTGETEKVAFQVTLMNSMKNYFTYSVTTRCGIPKITLEGTVEDWQNIEKRAQAFAKYDLEWWVEDLLPILHKFTEAAAGKPDVDFWKSIYKWEVLGSDGATISGWILNFFPYLKDRDELYPLVGRKQDDTLEINYTKYAMTNNFESGICQLSFILNDNGAFFQMEFAAGFVGCRQDSTTYALRPEIGWAVIDKQMPATEEQKENYSKGGDKTYRKSIKNKN